jgi:serine/threonine protein kinase
VAKPSTDPELVYLDSFKLKRLLIERGLSDTRLKNLLNPDAMPDQISPNDRVAAARNTIDKALRGDGVRRDVAKFIADYFECNVLDLLDPRDPYYLPPTTSTTGMEWEWTIDGPLQRGSRMAANGLHFVLFRMKHRHTAGQLGRGKFYLLSGLAASDRDRKREQLQRHPQVCQQIGLHPQLAEVISSTPTAGEDGWWVVERWLDGMPLSDVLSAGRFPPADLPRLMREIAGGLSTLHRAKIVMRELAPSRVLLAKADSRAVLTDFELAKLLAGGPTVSPGDEWPEDPYRAEEVGPGEVTVQADLYSWGRILVHAAAGRLPARGEDINVVAKCGLPKRVWVTVQSCLEPAPSHRPASMEEVLEVIRDWKWRGSVDGR